MPQALPPQPSNFRSVPSAERSPKHRDRALASQGTQTPSNPLPPCASDLGGRREAEPAPRGLPSKGPPQQGASPPPPQHSPATPRVPSKPQSVSSGCPQGASGRREGGPGVSRARLVRPQEPSVREGLHRPQRRLRSKCGAPSGDSLGEGRRPRLQPVQALAATQGGSLSEPRSLKLEACGHCLHICGVIMLEFLPAVETQDFTSKP